MQKTNLIFEFIPLIVFFTVYYISKNLFVATGVCIIVTWIMVIIHKILYKSITKNMLLSALLLTIFGGASILLHNKTLVMIKPTVLYWILALSLFVSQLMNKNLLELSIGKELNLPTKIWRNLNFIWSMFFVFLGFLNLLIALYFEEAIWVRFKVFGSMGFMLLFLIITGCYVFFVTKKLDKID
jgi:intracellular septation protein